ncbi:MAG TPA: flagellar assembly protein FliW [Clostridiales bacterium]|nr:flagellar assembly protein FliW [Clostridiales bacterium]
MSITEEIIPLGRENAIKFVEGIYGFESINEYYLEPVGDDLSVLILQSANTRVPSFVVINPFLITDDYCPVLSDEEIKALGAESQQELAFYVIAVVKEDYKKTVVNLKSPIVINPKSRLAKQIILDNCDYPIRFAIFGNEG